MLRVAIIILGVLGIFAVFLFIAAGRKPQGAEILTAESEMDQDFSSESPRLTVLTWNIHFGCGPELNDSCDASVEQVYDFLSSIAATIREVGADIVALQEVDRKAFRTHGIDQLAFLQAATGMPYAAWTPTWQAGWVPHPGLNPVKHVGYVLSGQAILSRFPIVQSKRHDLPQPEANSALYNRFYLHRALLDSELRLTDSLHLRILNAHLEAFDVANRLQHTEYTAALLRETSLPTLLIGDINSVPTEATLRKAFPDEPETDMSRDTTVDVLLATGFEEVAVSHGYAEDESAHLTFPAHAPNRRLDYIFFEPRQWHLERAWVPQDIAPASDHRPVIAVLVWTGHE